MPAAVLPFSQESIAEEAVTSGIVERADDGYQLIQRGGELGQTVLQLARWAADWEPPPERPR